MTRSRTVAVVGVELLVAGLKYLLTIMDAITVTYPNNNKVFVEYLCTPTPTPAAVVVIQGAQDKTQRRGGIITRRSLLMTEGGAGRIGSLDE